MSSRATPAARCWRPDGRVYGVVFAAAVGVKDTGYALTASEVQGDAKAGGRRDQPGLHPGLRLAVPARAGPAAELPRQLPGSG